VTAIAAKGSKTRREKALLGARKPARRKAGVNATLAAAAKRKRARRAGPKSFSQVLDEVMRDYSLTLQKLA
jgi:hypothetical protein